MDRLLTEYDVTCPFCAERITLLIDASEGSQDYIEDCQVCCRPIEVAVMTDGENRVTVRVGDAN